MASNRPRKNPAGAIVALLILVMIVIALVVVLRQGGGEAQESPTPVAEETVSPSVSPAAEPEATPTPTPAPSETPEPTPSPEPTESPEPSEPAEPVVTDAEGTLRSDTGTGLNIVAYWTLSSAGNGEAELTVRLCAESYSLQTREIWQGASLEIGGASYEFDTSSVDYEGPGMGENELGELSVTLPADIFPAAASVSWHFQGSYGGEELEFITASGTIG